MNLPPLHQLSLRTAPTANIDEPPIADDFVELEVVLQRELNKPADQRAVKDVENAVYERLLASVPMWRAYNELERVSREVPNVEGDEAQITAQTAAIAVAQAQLDAATEALAGGGATREDIFDCLVDLMTWHGALFKKEQIALRLFETMNTWLIAAQTGGFAAPPRSRPPGFTSEPDSDSDDELQDRELLDAIQQFQEQQEEPLFREAVNYVHPAARAAFDEFVASLRDDSVVRNHAAEWIAATGLRDIGRLMELLARDLTVQFSTFGVLPRDPARVAAEANRLEADLLRRLQERMNRDFEYQASLQVRNTLAPADDRDRMGMDDDAILYWLMVGGVNRVATEIAAARRAGHAEGSFTISQNADARSLQRMIANRVENLGATQNAEREVALQIQIEEEARRLYEGLTEAQRREYNEQDLPEQGRERRVRLAFRIFVEQMGYADDSESDEEPLTTFSEDERPPNLDRQRTRDQILPPRRGAAASQREF